MTLSYKFEEGLYKIYNGDEPLFTPNDSPVVTTSETLAQRLVLDAERFKGDFSHPWSTLCLHFGACDIHAMDEDEKKEGLKEFVEEVIYNDPFLMFRQDCPVRCAIEVYFVDSLPSLIIKAEDHIKSSFINVNGTYRSMMLVNYIMTDIVKKNPDMVEENKAEFLDDLYRFCKEQGYNTRVKILTKKTLAMLVDTLSFYMSIKKVF